MKQFNVPQTETISFYGEAKVQETIQSLKDSYAVFAGGRNITTGEGVSALPCEVKYNKITVMIPLRIFEAVFGAKIVQNKDEFSVTLEECQVNGSLDTAQGIANGVEFVFDIPPYREDDEIFVPGRQMGELLGKCAEQDGRFLVVGTQNAVDKMHRIQHLGVNEYSEIAAYLSYYREIDPTKISISEVEEVKRRWKKDVVGDATTNDLTDKDIRLRIETINRQAKASRDLMIWEERSQELFSDIESTTSVAMRESYHHLHNMAKAYATAGGEYYRDQDLKEAIRYGMEWMHQNRYGDSKDTGWTITGFNNWADWRHSSPKFILEILLFMEEDFTDEEIKKYLYFFDKNNPMPITTGGNFIFYAEIISLSALLQKDYKKVLRVLGALEKMYLYVDDNERITESQLRDEERKAKTPMKGAGFFTDGSYILHTLHAMNGFYGVGHFTSLIKFEKCLAGTVFQLNAPFRYHLPMFYRDTIESVIYGKTMFRHVLGRVPDGRNIMGRCMWATQAMGAGYSLSNYFKDEERDWLLGVVRSAIKENPQIVDEIVKILSIDEIKAFKEFVATDETVSNQESGGNKVLYNEDKVVHKTPDWAVGISMSSSRVFNYECINNQNTTGWYMGDGRTEYYLWGSDKNATPGYWNHMNHYRLPGTTVDTQERKAVSVLQGNEYLSSKDFVGAVSLRNRYGVAAMELESYHNETDYGIYSAGGEPNPAHQSDLTARKAYFMFDDEVVCLGNSVNAKANKNAEVLTVVDNLLSEMISSPEGVLNVAGEREISGMTWLQIENTCGYVFPGENTENIGNLRICRTEQTPSYTEIWFSHGVNPTDGGYAYILLPGKDKEYTRAYAENRPAKILENNKNSQVVRKENTTGIVFWDKGRYGYIATDVPCILMYDETETEFCIAICDPTQKLKEATVTIDLELKLVQADEMISCCRGESGIVLNLNFTGSCGRSIEAVFKK